MTNTNASRLDRIENDLETVKDIMLTLARRAEETDERIDRLVDRQDLTQRQLDQLSIRTDATDQRIDGIVALQTQTQSQLDQLAAAMVQTAQSFAANQASILAALERQDRILDYLMQRDRNGENG